MYRASSGVAPGPTPRHERAPGRRRQEAQRRPFPALPPLAMRRDGIASAGRQQGTPARRNRRIVTQSCLPFSPPSPHPTRISSPALPQRIHTPPEPYWKAGNALDWGRRCLEAQNRNCLGHSRGPTPGTCATEKPSEVTIVIIAWNITTFGKIGPFWEAFLLPTQISHPNGLITKYNLRFFWTPSSHPFIPSMRKRKAPEIARDLRRGMEDAAVRSRSAGQIACGAAWSAARSQPPGFRPTARN
jgi:hypothetical protein